MEKKKKGCKTLLIKNGLVVGILGNPLRFYGNKMGLKVELPTKPQKNPSQSKYMGSL